MIGATSQQYPLQMAALGVEAIAKFAADGSKPRRPKASPSSTPVWRSSPKAGRSVTSIGHHQGHRALLGVITV